MKPNPYASELTMPDGTTRAPLIARLPEDATAEHDLYAPRIDLAICRMAAMDWLDKQGVDGKLALLAALSCDDGSSVDERIARHAHLILDAEEVK